MRSALALFVLALAQAPATPMTFSALRAVRPAAERPATSQEVTIRWGVYAAPNDALASPSVAVPLNDLQLVSQRDLAHAAPLERNPELAPDRLVIAALDASGAVLSWRIIADPRIVRSEGPGPDGVLTGVTLFRREVEFPVAMPAHPTMRSVRIYEPKWNGQDWMLEPIGTVALGGVR